MSATESISDGPTYGRTDGLTGGGVGAKDTQILLLYCHRHSEINFTLTAVSSTVSIAKLGTVIFILHSCKYVGGVESTVTVNWSLPINWSLPSQLIPSLSTGPFPVNWSLPSQLIPSQSTDQSSQSNHPIYLLTCSPCSPNNTIITIIWQFYCFTRMVGLAGLIS